MTSPRRDALVVTILYFALTLVLTWPLARSLTRDLPADLGDPLLNTWILAWDATHLGRGWWSANIFAPHPLALAYSEHLPQGLQALPVYRDDEESDPRLQPGLPCDVRPLRARDVSVRPRADRLPQRRLPGGAGVWLRALSLRVAVAPSGVVLDVDAVRLSASGATSRRGGCPLAGGPLRGSRRTCRAATTCCSSPRSSCSSSPGK